MPRKRKSVLNSKYSARDRLNDDSLYAALMERLHFDYELYHYARELCLRQMIANGIEFDMEKLKPVP